MVFEGQKLPILRPFLHAVGGQSLHLWHPRCQLLTRIARKVILSLTVCQMLISLTTISQRSSRNSAWSHLVFQLSPTWSLTRFSLNSALDYQKQLATSEKNIAFFEQTRNLFRLVTNCFGTYFLRISGEMLKKIAYTLPNASKSIHFHIRCKSFLSVSRPPTSCSYSKEELGGH